MSCLIIPSTFQQFEKFSKCYILNSKSYKNRYLFSIPIERKWPFEREQYFFYGQELTILIDTTRSCMIQTFEYLGWLATVVAKDDLQFILGHTRPVQIPDCVVFNVTLNACRGFCKSFAIPSPSQTLRTNSKHLITSRAECCSIKETHDVSIYGIFRDWVHQWDKSIRSSWEKISFSINICV